MDVTLHEPPRGTRLVPGEGAAQGVLSLRRVSRPSSCFVSSALAQNAAAEAPPRCAVVTRRAGRTAGYAATAVPGPPGPRRAATTPIRRASAPGKVTFIRGRPSASASSAQTARAVPASSSRRAGSPRTSTATWPPPVLRETLPTTRPRPGRGGVPAHDRGVRPDTRIRTHMWQEKDGVLTRFDRRFQWVRPAAEAPSARARRCG